MNQKSIVLLMFLLSFLTGCSQPTTFSEKAMADTFLTSSGEVVSFETILKENEGRTVFVDIWATWCKDCIVSMPDIKKLVKDYPEASFVYISLDKDEKSWKKGIKRYKLTDGQHYWSSKGWDSDFFDAIDLDWIPRYMVVDEKREIKLFKAIMANDINIVEQIRSLKDEK